MDSSSSIVPCLWFDDQAEAAAEFYTTTIGGSILGASRYPDSGGNPGGKPDGSVLTVEFEVVGQHLTALNGGPNFTPNPSVSFFIETGSAAEVDRLFAAFADQGTTLMALDSYPWSERYGWVQDRFGVSWQVTLAPGADTAITTSLLFAGAHQGEAQEAMAYYASVFPDGAVNDVTRYGEMEGTNEGPAGQVAHASFTLMGQAFAAMDSGVPQPYTFTEGVSLQVMCDDQAEIDRFWDALSHDPAWEQCGWLKDRFGVSWQIVPRRISEWMSSDDREACDRAFRAMMPMKKLDMAELEAAFRGDH